jgi:hypothetical protein
MMEVAAQATLGKMTNDDPLSVLQNFYKYKEQQELRQSL